MAEKKFSERIRRISVYGETISGEEKKKRDRLCHKIKKFNKIKKVAKHAAQMMRKGGIICNAFQHGLAKESHEKLARLNELGFYTMDGDGPDSADREPIDSDSTFAQVVKHRFTTGIKPRFFSIDQHGWVFGAFRQRLVPDLCNIVSRHAPEGLFVFIDEPNGHGMIASRNNIHDVKRGTITFRIVNGFLTDDPAEFPVTQFVHAGVVPSGKSIVRHTEPDAVLSKRAEKDLFKNYVGVYFISRLPTVDALQSAIDIMEKLHEPV